MRELRFSAETMVSLIYSIFSARLTFNSAKFQESDFGTGSASLSSSTFSVKKVCKSSDALVAASYTEHFANPLWTTAREACAKGPHSKTRGDHGGG